MPALMTRPHITTRWLLPVLLCLAGCNWNPTLEVLPERDAMGPPTVFKGEQLIRLYGIEFSERLYTHDFMQVFTRTYREADTVVVVDVYEFKYFDGARHGLVALSGRPLPTGLADVAAGPAQHVLLPMSEGDHTTYWMLSGRCVARLVQTRLAPPPGQPVPVLDLDGPAPSRDDPLVNRTAWQLHQRCPMLYQFP
ncbi:MAG: hypothetical protein ACOCXX_00495 [Planctomycetota bacterium]